MKSLLVTIAILVHLFYNCSLCCLAWVTTRILYRTNNNNKKFFQQQQRWIGSTSSSTGPTNSRFYNDAWIARKSSARGRKSLVDVSCQGLFGLGIPEIAIISLAAFFVFGPQFLTRFTAKSLGRDMGKLSNEIKDIPMQFQKGMEEGEIEAKSRNAKLIMGIDTKEKVK
jgi:sec-independent protein translocase protein TatA